MSGYLLAEAGITIISNSSVKEQWLSDVILENWQSWGSHLDVCPPGADPSPHHTV